MFGPRPPLLVSRHTACGYGCDTTSRLRGVVIVTCLGFRFSLRAHNVFPIDASCQSHAATTVAVCTQQYMGIRLFRNVKLRMAPTSSILVIQTQHSFPHILRVWLASPATCYQAYRVRIRLRYDVEASRRRYRNVPWLPSLPASALRFPHRRTLPVTCRHHYGRVHRSGFGEVVRTGGILGLRRRSNVMVCSLP